MTDTRRILVTGSHRSGTTWLGRVLSASTDVYYIAEPFNISFNHPDNPIDKWFYYIPSDKKDARVYNYLKHHFHFSPKALLSDLKKINSLSWAKGIAIRQAHKMFRPYKVMKDPIAIMSAEWLAANFDMKVVVSIRHPAAFASSLKVKGWKFDFSSLLSQRDLISNHLSSFEPEVKRLAENEHPIVEQAGLLWNMIYTRVWQYSQTHTDWMFVRHEDISSHPEIHFEKLLEYMGIPYSEQIRQMVRATTSAKKNKNTIEESLRDSLYRDSRQNIKSWKDRQTHSEADFMRGYTRSVWNNFYDESDW